MSKAAFIRARIEPGLKEHVEHILDLLGITPTQAVTMLYKKIAREQEWPLELKIPNPETHKELMETDKGIGLIENKSIDHLFQKLKIQSNSHKKTKQE